MRIAVTGATGFLGRHFVNSALERGHQLVALVRDRTKGEALWQRGVHVLTGDLAGPLDLSPDLSADAMVHMAALSSNWGPRQDFLTANVAGTATAIGLARQLRVRRLVHISSPSIYFRFRDQLNVGEDTPLPPPINAYSESKQLAERLVVDAADLNPVILRPRGIYGSGDVSLLPRLVRAARQGPLPLLRGGRARTDLTHVDDVVAAILAAIETSDAIPALAINISGGEPLPIRHIVDTACARAGVTVRWRALPTVLAFGGARLVEALCATLPGRPEPIATAYSLGVFAYSQTLDISRAKSVLNWVPKISLAEGLGRL